MRRLTILLGLALLPLLAFGPPALGAQQADQTITLGEYFSKGGGIAWAIAVIFLACVAITITEAIRLWLERFAPDPFFREVREKIRKRRWDEAREFCRENKSILARVLDRALMEMEFFKGRAKIPDQYAGKDVVADAEFEKWEYRVYQIMEPAIDEELGLHHDRLERRLALLDFFTQVAPMLGLLGTVTGMIRSFKVIAYTEGAANASQLAGGISEALITTFGGLVVAILFMAALVAFRKVIGANMDLVLHRTQDALEVFHSKAGSPAGGGDAQG